MIAQFNVAWMRRPWDDPIWRAWERLVPLVNARADGYPGFRGNLRGGPYLMPWTDRPMVMGNLTLWDGERELEAFLIDRVHTGVWAQRARWFLPPQLPVWAITYEADRLDLGEARAEFERRVGKPK